MRRNGSCKLVRDKIKSSDVLLLNANYQMLFHELSIVKRFRISRKNEAKWYEFRVVFIVRGKNIFRNVFSSSNACKPLKIA